MVADPRRVEPALPIMAAAIALILAPQRNLIERCVNRLKQFRRIATRYEKTARAYNVMYGSRKAQDQNRQQGLDRTWIGAMATTSPFDNLLLSEREKTHGPWQRTAETA